MSVKVNLTRYKQLKAQLHLARSARVRVGILGNKAERQNDDWSVQAKNNPTIGYEHEFGVKKNKWGRATRPRSWLRMPLFTRLITKIDQIGKAVWRDLILKTSVVNALSKVGGIGENLIQESFNTGGFGTWKALAEITIRRKKSSAILIETGRFRQSVSSKVVLGKARP